MNAYFVRLPKLTELTPHQRMAIDNVNAIFISGLAGTGKSVCLIYRYINCLKSNKGNCAYLTFTKTLREYTKLCVEQENYNAHEIYCAMSFDKDKHCKDKHYKEIIVDEAQDLEHNTLQSISNKTDVLSVGADFKQQIYSNKIAESNLKILLPNHTKYELKKVFRNSFNILNFIVKNWHPTLYTIEDLEALKKENLGRKPTLCIGGGAYL